MIPLTFFVDGIPVPKARPRVAIRKTRAGRAFGQAYTPKTTQQWEEAVRWQCRAACSAIGWKPSTRPVEVRLVIHRKSKRGDADNHAKSLLDAMNGIAYEDDSLVTDLTVRIRDVCAPEGKPGGFGAWVYVGEAPLEADG